MLFCHYRTLRVPVFCKECVQFLSPYVKGNTVVLWKDLQNNQFRGQCAYHMRKDQHNYSLERRKLMGDMTEV